MEDSITLYSSPTCPKCRMLKMSLEKKAIPFEECHDIDVLTNLGIKSVPVLSVNGTLLHMQEAMEWIKEH